MSAILIDGRAAADDIRNEIKGKVQKAKAAGRRPPGLAVLIVGENPASQTYVRGKRRAAEEAGFHSVVHELPAGVSRERLLYLIDELNADLTIDGILCQLPLPTHLSEDEVTVQISPEKDVDGFHPINMGRLALGLEGFVPCTPLGCRELLIRYKVPTAGRRVVVVGRSRIVGAPMALLMMRRGEGGDATVAVCHSRAADLPAECKRADILISALGVPRFITAEMVKEGATVIDVGINRVVDASTKTGFRLVGDVDFDAVKAKASAITPVPGGVGPMTIAMLLKNSMTSWERKNLG